MHIAVNTATLLGVNTMFLTKPNAAPALPNAVNGTEMLSGEVKPNKICGTHCVPHFFVAKKGGL